MMKLHLQMLGVLLLSAGFTGCSVAGGTSSASLGPAEQSGLISAPKYLRPVDRFGFASTASVRVAMQATSADINIDAGGPTTANWSADAYYTGGHVATVTHAINTALVVNPAPQAVYQSQRYAAQLAYTIPNLSPQVTYNVRLHFVESYFSSAGRRLFDVTMNGNSVLKKFDIESAAGGADIAIIKSFSTSADTTGKITISLTSSVNNASIAGIEIIAASPTPTPTPTALPQQAFNGVVSSSLSTWDHWVGNSAQIIGLYNDSQASTWSALNDIVWLLSTQPTATPVVWSLGTYPTSSNLASVAAGSGNAYYATWAAEILSNGSPASDGYFYVRPNWEVPGPWFSWGAQCAASPSNCIAAFQQIATVFHSASPKFKIVWDTFPIYGNKTDNSVYYPGDSYVDVVAQDIYPDTTNGNTAASAWNYVLTEPNGLNWLSAFASAHGKRIAVNEWGLNSDTASPIVGNMSSWLKQNNAIYEVYFDSGTTQLSSNQFPTVGTTFKSYF